MPDPNATNTRPLSEISHLFLSSLREQAQQGQPRPMRIPPGGQGKPVVVPPAPITNLSPASPLRDDPQSDEPVDVLRKRVTAVVGAHLNGHLADRVVQYASQVAQDAGKRLGVVQIGAAEFRITIVEPGEPVEADASVDADESLDDRRMSEALLELNNDVDRWLLVLPDQRCAESRSLMRMVDDWLLMCTCDHDGIVAGYRTLKGLADGAKAPLAIALLDAVDPADAEKVYAKLAGVCRQFLDWDVEPDACAPRVTSTQALVQTVLWCRSTRDKAQLASAPQWHVMADFLEIEPDAEAQAAHFGTRPEEPVKLRDDASDEFEVAAQTASVRAPAPVSNPAPKIVPQTISHAAPAIESTPTVKAMTIVPAPVSDLLGEVIDLPAGASVLSAVLSKGTGLIATPIEAPMCPGATIAVSRERGLVLVAQAGTGLSGLGSIANAVKWLEQSRQVIAMAMPQLHVDASVPIRAHLLVDHADRDADALRPLLGNDRVVVQSYRKLRWGEKTGLLLDAA
jgi:hypothetical protein